MALRTGDSMSNHHRRSFIRPLLLAACAAVQGFAGSTVTISNHSGNDLLVVRAGGKAVCPIRITAESDETPGTPHFLCPPPAPGGTEETKSPEGSSLHKYLLRAGDTATFRFEAHGKDLEAELVLYRCDSDNGVALNGIVIFSLAHKPAPLPDGIPEPEARLSLPEGPTPRTRTLPCNRKVQLVSPVELKIRP